MKFKTSAIALAVAGTVAAPVAVQAGADEIYASVRVGVENVDTGGTSDLRTRSFGSRFGARGETDLGNGLTGFGRYEWDVDFQDHNQDVVDRTASFLPTTDTDYDSSAVNAGDGDDIDIRHRYVGIKGDFGSLTIGQTYHTYYNHIVGPVDNPWWGSGYAMVDYVGRTDGGVTYAGSTGAVSFGITAHFFREDEEEAPDVTEIAASFGIGDMTLGIGARLPADDQSVGNGMDEDVIGITLSGIALGDASLGITLESQDDDSGVTLDLGIGNAYVHIETESLDDDDEDPMSVTLGYTQSLGRKTTAWYEIVDFDADTSDSDDDSTVVRAVLKYDII